MTIKLVDLIVPFRYDILVRRRFLSRFDRLQRIFGPLAWLPAAFSQDLFLWYRGVKLSRREESAGTIGIFMSYLKHARRFGWLYREMKEKGFDTRFPIPLYVSDNPLLNDRPYQGAERVFICDGSHRLAILWHQGRRALSQEMYRFEFEEQHSIRNNTNFFLQKGLLETKELAAFLALKYGESVEEEMSLCGRSESRLNLDAEKLGLQQFFSSSETGK